MDRNLIIDLLAAAAGHDDRLTATKERIDAWEAASNKARWPSFRAAKDAIDEHYATSTDRIMPANITERIKAAARQPLPLEPDEEDREKPPANPLHIARCVAWAKADQLRIQAKKHPDWDVAKHATAAKVELFKIASPEWLRMMRSDEWARELEASPDYDPDRVITVGKVDPAQAVGEMIGTVGMDLTPLEVACDYEPCRAPIGFFCTGVNDRRLLLRKFHPSREEKAAKVGKAS